MFIASLLTTARKSKRTVNSSFTVGHQVIGFGKPSAYRTWNTTQVKEKLKEENLQENTWT